MAPRKSKSKKESHFESDPEVLETPDSTPHPDFNLDESGNDLGGLMSTLARGSKKKLKPKKDAWEDTKPTAKTQYSDESGEEQSMMAKKSKKGKKDNFITKSVAVEASVSAFAALMGDDESQSSEDDQVATPVPAPVKQDKQKKEKKQTEEDDEVELLMQQMNTKSSKKKKAPPPAAPEDEEPTQMKSKKEKEKERKERLKIAKKEQDKKKPSTLDSADPISSQAPSVQSDVASALFSNPTKKSNAPIAALKQMMELKRLAELERLRLEQEDIELERLELLAIETAAKEKEESRREKKEREREKKDALKKSGKYLTPAQKKKEMMNEKRREVMLKSGGVLVQGMRNQDDTETRDVKEDEEVNEEKPKRVVYGKKKKVVQVVKEEVKEKAWDDSDGDEKPSWDADSEEEDAVTPEAVTPISVAPVAVAPVVVAVPVKAEETAVEVSDLSGSESESDSDSSEEELTATQKQALQQREEAAKRKQKKHEEALASRSKTNLRSPIGCILGHVDTGKTKLLDRIRQTNVQEGEAGGITQQIGATYFPIEAIALKTAALTLTNPIPYLIPGLLIIDTPGHESFTNLRSRGSSLCNIAILVVDITHGLEPQTIESLNLLKQRKTPFIVALNKIDRLYGWVPTMDGSLRESLKKQPAFVIKEYNERVEKTILAFAEQGLNSCLYYDNKNYAKNVSLVPTSAITGEGIPDMLQLLIHLCQSRMSEQLMYLSEVEATVLEVKVVEGLGTTIDVILSNGYLREGDRIVLCGLNGPIVTTIRALLTPQPMRELRLKSAYVKHKEVKAALGVKVSAADLEKAIAGSRVLVLGEDDDEEELKEEVMKDLSNLMERIDKTGKGVCVQASTLGSLEALLVFLKDMEIPVSGINIGPVHKKDVIRASVMLERAREYAQLLAFDVPIDRDAELLAEEMGVKIFRADIIYHLFDAFKAYMADIQEQRRKDEAPQVVFPCVLKIVPGAVFNKRSPLVMGVDVVEGQLRIGTPLCVMNELKEIVVLGKVTGIEHNHKQKEIVRRGDPSVAIKVEVAHYETPRMFGRHFTQDDELMSRSIDILKTTFRNDLTKDEWALVVRLKKKLNID